MVEQRDNNVPSSLKLIVEIVCTFVSGIISVLDIVFDILAAYECWNHEEYTYAIIISVFNCFSALVLSLISLAWLVYFLLFSMLLIIISTTELPGL